MTELEFKLVLNEKLCDLAEAILHYYNPCRRGKNSCFLYPEPVPGKGCCYKTKFDDKDREDRRCQFLSTEGCRFRNIGCKIWLCAPAIGRADLDCIESLRALEKVARRYGLMRRPFLGDRYVGKAEELLIVGVEQV